MLFRLDPSHDSFRRLDIRGMQLVRTWCRMRLFSLGSLFGIKSRTPKEECSRHEHGHQREKHEHKAYDDSCPNLFRTTVCRRWIPVRTWRKPEFVFHHAWSISENSNARARVNLHFPRNPLTHGVNDQNRILYSLALLAVADAADITTLSASNNDHYFWVICPVPRHVGLHRREYSYR